MFDPVPTYDKSSESARQDLDAFSLRVAVQAERYGVDCSSRFSCILTACDRLNDLRNSMGKDVWKPSEKEPVEDFQNIFQLLIYALGDQGLLYDRYGFWSGEPNIDFWEESSRSYMQLALSMRTRNFVYRRLQDLRKSLKSHADLQYGMKSGSDDCTIAAAAVLVNNAFPSLKKKDCYQVVAALRNNHLFRQVPSLYLFFALAKEQGPLSAADFRARLKQNASVFPPQRTAPQIARGREDYLNFLKCQQLVGRIEPLCAHFVSCFDPFYILSQLREEDGLAISDEQLVTIANHSLKLPSDAYMLSKIADIKVGGVPILDVMDAFSRVLTASNVWLEEGDRTLPRAFKQSIRILYQAGASEYLADEPLLESDCFSDEQYDEIKRAVLYKYGQLPLPLSQETFWLITGYVPPIVFCPEDDQDDLYSLCFRHLRELWYPYYSLLHRQIPGDLRNGSFFDVGAQYSNNLYQDILKAKSEFASHWDCATETELFLQKLQEVRDLYWPADQQKLDRLRKFVLEQYDKIKSPKTSFKSFGYARDEIGDALLVECFSLTAIHLQRSLFELLASLNQWLWYC